MDSLDEIFENLKDYLKESIGIKELIGQKLSLLPPKDFEQILHSVFKEEEFLLILIGAIIGGLIGLLQAFYFLI